MGSFSSLIDVSSFFIGILINLLLVAMICYYFKRKIDNLEMSQSEQAKMMYSLLQEKEKLEQQNMQQQNNENSEDNENNSTLSKNVMLDLGLSTHSYLNNLDLNSLDGNNNEILNITENTQNEYVEESSDDETTMSIQDEDEDENEDEKYDNENNNLKTVEMNLELHQTEKSYEKMTVKELKQIIEERGIVLTKKSLKKNEYIDILMNNSVEEEPQESSEEEVEPDSEPEPETNEEDEVELNTDELQPETLNEDDEENNDIIKSMQSQVENVIKRNDKLGARTFSLDLNLDADVDILN